MEIWFDPAEELDAALRRAAGTLPEFSEHFSPEMRPADPRFGDYQANGVLAEAKRAKANPRALAGTLVEALKNSGELDASLVEISVAGPGFINFRLAPAFLGGWLARFRGAEDFRRAAHSACSGKKIVIDYPSPNTAKQMHVGHLRIMDIGEAVARLLAFCGANLIRDNHIGDWGTNFGVLLFEIKRSGFAFPEDDEAALERLEELYKSGTAFTKENPEALDAARAELVRLQQGDPENTALWKRIVRVSDAACEKLYRVFGVKPDVTLGESFYRDKVGRVYDELLACGIARAGSQRRTTARSSSGTTKIRASPAGAGTPRRSSSARRTAARITPRRIWRRCSTASNIFTRTKSSTSRTTASATISGCFSTRRRAGSNAKVTRSRR